MSERPLTIRQTAERIGVSERWVRSRIQNNTLPFAYMKVGKVLRVEPSAVETYLRSCTREAVSA